MMTNNSVWLIVFKTLLFAKLSVLLTGSKTQVYNHVQHSKNLNKFKIFGTGFLMQLTMKLLKKLDACKSVLILIMLLWTSEKKLFLGINQSGFRNFMLSLTLKLWKKGINYYVPHFHITLILQERIFLIRWPRFYWSSWGILWWQYNTLHSVSVKTSESLASHKLIFRLISWVVSFIHHYILYQNIYYIQNQFKVCDQKNDK